MPRLSEASVYLSGGSEVHPIPLFLSPRAAYEPRLELRKVAQSEYKTAKNGFLENIRDRERLRPAGSDDSHKFWAEESSGLYAFFLSVSSIGKNGIIKAKDFSQLREPCTDRKIAGEPAENRGYKIQTTRAISARKHTKNPQSLMLCGLFIPVGAEGETRTPMPLPALDPEPSVSTNSTTSALLRMLVRSSFFLCKSFFLFFRKRMKSGFRPSVLTFAETRPSLYRSTTAPATRTSSPGSIYG